MIDDPKLFKRRCTDAARAFIRTVAVIDDFPEWMTDPAVAASQIEVPLEARRPILGPPPLEEPVDGDPSSTVDTLPESPSHMLQTQQLIAEFADSGIVCSVMVSPKLADEASRTQWRNRAASIAGKADVLVSDWSWSGDGGSFCLSIIRRLLEANHGRRQLIVIYTGTDDGDAIRTRLKELTPAPAPIDENEFRFHWRSGLDVIVLQKPHAAAPFFESSLVSESELPERVIREFGLLSGGLLANAVMHGLGALRDRTHRVLDDFGPSVDAAYVVHRAYTSPRTGAEDQMVELLTDAVSDLFADNRVWEHLDDLRVSDWLRSSQVVRNQTSVQAVLGGSHTFEGLATGDVPSISGKKSPFLARLAARLAGRSEDESEDLHLQFGRLVYSALPAAGNRSPKLASGVLVLREPDEYLLCVLPLCDAERVPASGVSFPFLRVEAGNGKGRHFVVCDVRSPGAPQRFWVDVSMTRLVVGEFSPTPNDRVPVLAVRDDDDWVFFDRSNRRYRYVARLRPMVAQAISSGLGESGARIGLMESEYIRRDR